MRKGKKSEALKVRIFQQRRGRQHQKMEKKKGQEKAQEPCQNEKNHPNSQKTRVEEIV